MGERVNFIGPTQAGFDRFQHLAVFTALDHDLRGSLPGRHVVGGDAEGEEVLRIRQQAGQIRSGIASQQVFDLRPDG